MFSLFYFHILLSIFFFYIAPYSPYFPHIHGYRAQSAAKPDQFLTLCYEDMQRDPRKEIRKVAEFLNIHVTEEKVEEIASKTTFKAMKDNPSTNYKVLRGLLVPHFVPIM